METILVTGATGTVGGEVTRRLVAKGIRVRALARGASRTYATVVGVEPVDLDLRHGEGLGAAARGAGALFLLTPLEADMLSVSEQVIAAARREGVSRIVRLSAFGAGDSTLR